MHRLRCHKARIRRYNIQSYTIILIFFSLSLAFSFSLFFSLFLSFSLFFSLFLPLSPSFSLYLSANWRAGSWNARNYGVRRRQNDAPAVRTHANYLVKRWQNDVPALSLIFLDFPLFFFIFLSYPLVFFLFLWHQKAGGRKTTKNTKKKCLKVSKSV